MMLMEETPVQKKRMKEIFEEFSLVPKRVKWLIYLTVPQSLAFGYLVILITAYFPETDYFDAGDVGLLIAATGVTFVAGALPLAILSDKRGRKWILLMGMAATTPSILVFGLTRDMTWLIVASLVAGLSEGAFMATWNALIADLTVKEHRNAAFSLSFILGTIPFGAGFIIPMAFPPIESFFGWGSYEVHINALILMAAVSAFSPFAVWWLLRDYKEVICRKKYTWSPTMRRLLKFSGINSLIGLGAGFIIPLIPTWLLLRFGVPDEVSGPLLALSSVTMALGAIGSAYLAKKRGLVQAVVMSQALSTAFMFSLAFITSAAIAAIFYLIRAALMNMGVPLLDSMLMGIVSKEERGLASAINSVIWRLPNNVSTYIGGILLAQGFYDIPFFLATAFYVVAIALFYWSFKDVKPTT